MSRFVVYEEYGATYEKTIRDVATAAKNVKNWDVYQRGFEALANMLAPEKLRSLGDKKGLTVDDLLIKVCVNCKALLVLQLTSGQPIQRICKYPLLFADLSKYTPLVDGTEAHLKIEKVLYRLRETAAEMNKATDDKATQQVIQRSWKLQDLLVFQDLVGL